MAIIEFPTFEAAKAWYENPAYQEASQHRFKGGDYNIVIVDGLAQSSWTQRRPNIPCPATIENEFLLDPNCLTL